MSQALTQSTCLVSEYELRQGINNALAKGCSLATIEKKLRNAGGLKTLTLHPESSPQNPCLRVSTASRDHNLPLNPASQLPSVFTFPVSEKNASSPWFHNEPLSLVVNSTLTIQLKVNPLRPVITKLASAHQAEILAQLFPDLAQFSSVLSSLQLTLKTYCKEEQSSFQPCPLLWTHVLLLVDFPSHLETNSFRYRIGHVPHDETEMYFDTLARLDPRSTVSVLQQDIRQAFALITAVRETPLCQVLLDTSDQTTDTPLLRASPSQLELATVVSKWSDLRLHVGAPLRVGDTLQIPANTNTDEPENAAGHCIASLVGKSNSSGATYPELLSKYRTALLDCYHLHLQSNFSC